MGLEQGQTTKTARFRPPALPSRGSNNAIAHKPSQFVIGERHIVHRFEANDRTSRLTITTGAPPVTLSINALRLFRLQ
jgi:hypothetical protein